MSYAIDAQQIARLVHQDPYYFALQLNIIPGRNQQDEGICFACMERLKFTQEQVQQLHAQFFEEEKEHLLTKKTVAVATPLLAPPQEIKVSQVVNTPTLQFDLELENQ